MKAPVLVTSRNPGSGCPYSVLCLCILDAGRRGVGDLTGQPAGFWWSKLPLRDVTYAPLGGGDLERMCNYHQTMEKLRVPFNNETSHKLLFIRHIKKAVGSVPQISSLA